MANEKDQNEPLARRRVPQLAPGAPGATSASGASQAGSDQAQHPNRGQAGGQGARPAGGKPPAERARQIDTLLRCLVRATQEFNRPVGEADVRAASPSNENFMTADQFCRAAVRLGYQVKREPLDQRSVSGMPAPFVLVGGAKGPSRLALSRDVDGLLVYDPASGGQIVLPLERALAESEEAILIKRRADVVAGDNWRSAVSKRVRGVMAELIISSAVINVLALATPLFIMTLYNKVIPNQDLDTLHIFAFGMMTVYAFDGILRMVRGYVSSHTGARVDALIGSDVLHHFLNLPYSHFEQTPTGVLHERLRQLDTIRAFFTGQMPMTLVDLAFVILFLAVLFFIHPLLAAITVGSIPLFVLVSVLFHKKQEKLIQENFTARAAKSSTLSETVNNAVSVKSLGLESEIEKRWESRLALSAWTGFRSSQLSNMVSSIGHLLHMTVSLSILYIGAMLVIRGEMSIGALIAGNILATRAIAPLRMVVSAWAQLQEVRDAFKRLDVIMDQPMESTPGEVAPSPKLVGALTLENVSFSFSPDSAPVLKNVDISMQSGTVLGLIGPSGSGKTTLAKIIQGLYKPTEGRVLVDGTSIQHMSAPAFRQQIGVVPQETQLFAGSIRENIALGSHEKDPERIVAVSKFAGAHDFIQRLPRGYDTVIGERGTGLSAGQRQLLCIARALIRNPRLIVLDEATSDLDLVTEETFLKNLQRASRGRTIVIITHRVAPLAICDRVALLMNGTIERIGPPSEVIAFAKSRMAESAAQANR